MTETSTDQSAGSDGGNPSIFGHKQITRFLVGVMVVICCFLYSGTARWLHWPDESRFHGSLAQPPLAIGAFIAALFLLIVCTALGTIVLRRRYFLGGLLVAVAGLTTWAARGGSMTCVLFNANNTGANRMVFLQLLVELIVFMAVIAGIWNWLCTREFVRLPQTPPDKGRSTSTALLVQSAMMVILLLLLVATSQKKQVLAGVFFAGLLSTGAAENFFADARAVRWYWVGPLVAGVFGYIAAFLAPSGLETGDLKGMFGPMARVLPLDYASLGCAGALVGYWWMMPEGNGSPTNATTRPVS